MKKLHKPSAPLIRGKAARTNAGFQENISREKQAGMPTKQAVAVAYGEADYAKKKAHEAEKREYERKMNDDKMKMHKCIGKK